MEIIKEIGHINCSIGSLANFFSDIKNYKEVFSNEVSSFEILNENAFRIKIGSFPKISLTHSKSNKNSFSLKSNSINFEFENLIIPRYGIYFIFCISINGNMNFRLFLHVL